MTFEQQLLRELHHLNKNLEGIRKSLDKLIFKSEETVRKLKDADSMRPIVRCRDCAYYTADEMEYYQYCGSWCGQVEPDGFCAWGEKREDE